MDILSVAKKGDRYFVYLQQKCLGFVWSTTYYHWSNQEDRATSFWRHSGFDFNNSIPEEDVDKTFNSALNILRDANINRKKFDKKMNNFKSSKLEVLKSVEI